MTLPRFEISIRFQEEICREFWTIRAHFPFLLILFITNMLSQQNYVEFLRFIYTLFMINIKHTVLGFQTFHQPKDVKI